MKKICDAAFSSSHQSRQKKVQKSKQESRKCEPETVHGLQRRININKLTSKHPLHIIIPPGQLTAKERNQEGKLCQSPGEPRRGQNSFLSVSIAHHLLFIER